MGKATTVTTKDEINVPIALGAFRDKTVTRAAFCVCCFRVYLGKATATTRAALRSPTSVCDVLVSTLVRLHQPQEQRYPVLPVYVMFSCFLG